MAEIFISYSRADADFAEVLRRRIGEAAFTSWIDLEELRAGAEWRQEIDHAIRQSIALIVILTPAARSSDYVAYEWAFALGAEVKVLPVLLQPTQLPVRLAALQYLDFTRVAERPWQGLLDALRAAVEARPTHAIRVARTAPALVKAAVAALDQPDPQAMESAMLRLAQMELPESEAALVEALRHPLPDVRIAAASLLAQRGDPRAVPGLIEGNRHRRWHLELARRLRPIGSAALSQLREAVGDPDPIMRRDLVWALKEIGDAAVVPDLIRFLDDPDVQVRQEAARSLVQIATPEARAAVDRAMTSFLDDLSNGNEHLQRRTVQFLESLGTPDALAAAATWRADGNREMREAG